MSTIDELDQQLAAWQPSSLTRRSNDAERYRRAVLLYADGHTERQAAIRAGFDGGSGALIYRRRIDASYAALWALAESIRKVDVKEAA